MRLRMPGVVISSEPRSDGQLSIVEVDWKDGSCVLSNGHVLRMPYEKGLKLCEQLCLERAAITVRIWTGRDGDELIHVHRVGERPTVLSMGETSNDAPF